MRYLVLLLLAGCAQNLTVDEEYKRWHQRQVDIENWNMCKQVIRVEIHDNHRADHRRNKHADIRSDLWTNSCRWVLRDNWIEL